MQFFEPARLRMANAMAGGNQRISERNSGLLFTVHCPWVPPKAELKLPIDTYLAKAANVANVAKVAKVASLPPIPQTF